MIWVVTHSSMAIKKYYKQVMANDDVEQVETRTHESVTTHLHKTRVLNTSTHQI